MVRRERAHRLGVELLFNAALALVSELVVRVTGWSRLPVLIAVFAVGHLVRGLVGGWVLRRGVGGAAARQPGAGVGGGR